MSAATSAVSEQILKDNLQVMDGGHVTLRDGRYVICPRRSNQHIIDVNSFFAARERGYAVMDDRHDVHVTQQGWAFCGMI